ncbi:aminopeptidase P family protein [Prevotella sp. KH2C16]|uniref:aminopeptidase P family protein n=1 Tax=Prevotella sp. KH2C16 TaxID=1855325 RepID=UPI0008E3A32A|nr:aminopeptidase P family protein [Prevotella sp. KH2C16]SFG51054.1 Xaa-Pro aminopeptidase [Prevotella sp. KH2C16]
MKEEICRRIEALREVMRMEKLDAFIFPSTDAHQSEYVADHWKGREWISGFDGSAGTAVVTMAEAALWTDSRYFLAAEEQLADTEFQLMRLKMAGTPSIAEWLGTELENINGAIVGLDGSVNSYATVQRLTMELRARGGINLRINFDPLTRIWPDRPPIPHNKVELQPLEYAGETTGSKLRRIRGELRKAHCDGMLLSALDDIAWTLNLRGTDVHCVPVFVAYLLIASDKTTLYINKEKVPREVAEYLASEGVGIGGYEEVEQGLKDYFEYNILMDPDETNALLPQFVPVRTRVVFAKSPVLDLKAVKNAAEIAGFRRAMTRDGVAMVKFLRWLKPAVAGGGETERSIDRKLTELRRQQPLFRDISFDTIAGYQEHGAIVHYEATEASDKPLKAEGLLLLDSGAQYQDGTTDITRTIALGPVTDEQRHVYTLVLKGFLRLQALRFPDGACGTQLDAVARAAMWEEGYNFLHGTGHGVGSYLSVHEGPHQIRMEHVAAPLRAGMTVTDEPGIYLAGRFGVRIENTLLTREAVKSEFGTFLEFEPLTLCPVETEPIDMSLLTGEEREWLNEYHRLVFDRLSPYLDEEETAWLAAATKAV